MNALAHTRNFQTDPKARIQSSEVCNQDGNFGSLNAITSLPCGTNEAVRLNPPYCPVSQGVLNLSELEFSGGLG